MRRKSPGGSPHLSASLVFLWGGSKHRCLFHKPPFPASRSHKVLVTRYQKYLALEIVILIKTASRQNSKAFTLITSGFLDLSWEDLDQIMKMQPNTVTSILSLNGPIPKSDYKLQSKPTWGRMEIWVSVGTCTILRYLSSCNGSQWHLPRAR